MQLRPILHLTPDPRAPIVEPFESDLWAGYVPAPYVDMSKKVSPSLVWKGAKFPVPFFRKLVSFFKWALTEHNAEAQARLLYHAGQQQWAACVLPQQVSFARTIETATNAERASILGPFLRDGYLVAGSCHSHARMSAFQSEVDEADEQGWPGIHLTVGCLGDATAEVHARFAFRGLFFEVPIADLLDAQPYLERLAHLPGGLREKTAVQWALFDCLHLAAPLPDVPEEWKAAVSPRHQTWDWPLHAHGANEVRVRPLPPAHTPFDVLSGEICELEDVGFFASDDAGTLEILFQANKVFWCHYQKALASGDIPQLFDDLAGIQGLFDTDKKCLLPSGQLAQELSRESLTLVYCHIDLEALARLPLRAQAAFCDWVSAAADWAFLETMKDVP